MHEGMNGGRLLAPRRHEAARIGLPQFIGDPGYRRMAPGRGGTGFERRRKGLREGFDIPRPKRNALVRAGADQARARFDGKEARKLALLHSPAHLKIGGVAQMTRILGKEIASEGHDGVGLGQIMDEIDLTPENGHGGAAPAVIVDG